MVSGATTLPNLPQLLPWGDLIFGIRYGTLINQQMNRGAFQYSMTKNYILALSLNSLRHTKTKSLDLSVYCEPLVKFFLVINSESPANVPLRFANK